MSKKSVPGLAPWFDVKLNYYCLKKNLCAYLRQVTDAL